MRETRRGSSTTYSPGYAVPTRLGSNLGIAVLSSNAKRKPSVQIAVPRIIAQTRILQAMRSGGYVGNVFYGVDKLNSNT